LRVTDRVESHFHRRALSFDALYDEDALLSRRLRPGLVRRRELAVATVRSYSSPRVLDIGCGSGRVGEYVLEACVAEYVGIDLASPMLDLARDRLGRFKGRVRLVHGDFLTAALDGPFDVVLCLGLFDYLADPTAAVRLIGDLCRGSSVASFPKWHWLKGPIRKFRYEVVNDCPIFDYTEPQIRRMFADAGFSRVDVLTPGNAGYLVRADNVRASRQVTRP
jgi:SAM-dependent methyltransferase